MHGQQPLFSADWRLRQVVSCALLLATIAAVERKLFSMPMKHLLLLFVPILVRGYKTHVAEQPDDIPNIPSQLHDTVQAR